MSIRALSQDLSVTDQITPDQVGDIAGAGYKSIICARPDGEEPRQPDFQSVARAAEAAGLTIVHIPVSGIPEEDQVIQFHEAWPRLPKPVLGYCHSGARATSLYQTLDRSGAPAPASDDRKR